MKKLIEIIKEYEKLFSDNKYGGSGNKAFTIEEGTIPIMISAPHAINQYREGQIKWADMYTGGITRYLHTITGCHIMYSCMFTKSDPNYDPPELNKYQKSLKEYLDKNKINFLIDLHGAAKTREYAVEMGTAPIQNSFVEIDYDSDPSLHEYKFVANIIKNTLEEKLKDCNNNHKEVWKNKIFNAGEQNTVTKFISENTNTPCIQLEINGIYRNPDNANEFTTLVNALAELIIILNKVDWNLTQ